MSGVELVGPCCGWTVGWCMRGGVDQWVGGCRWVLGSMWWVDGGWVHGVRCG